MRVDELQQILDDHRMWVTGQGGSRANLGGANLREANLGDVKWINARPLQLSGSQHTITALSPGRVLIGCHSKSIDQWLEHYKAIGRAENYSVDQVEEYGAHLRHVAAWLERAARLGWFERVD